MTVVDALGVANDERNVGVWNAITSREPNATICWDIDIPGWKALLYSVLRP
jgi:hypothetical protein